MRRDLPSGTVTFLFTDVEGSTQLLHELGTERYAEALAEHRRLLRRAFTAHGGVEVDTQGDAFFVAFPTAAGALQAADEVLRELERGPIRIRVGIHTGTPHVADEGYVGVDVHRAARIAAAGHGGQVLLSRSTVELLGADGLHELGEHRLKDFDEPVPLYQLGKANFPPLRTISNTNLPRPASSFVGREREVAQVAALLQSEARLLTLTGPGGSGKTRLAIEAAAGLVPEFKAGVFWVGLAPLRDPALVPDTIARTLGAKDGLAEHIGERELLLLLDNFEQVIEAAPEVASLLESCPNLRLLVTSRELLRVRGEHEYPVLPLADPEAVELFCARAGTPADDTIHRLCRALDNLPLAVELAAARTSVLSPRQILERLSGRLDLLRGGRDADPRQQTLRATVEWSHELLSAEERRLFARLAVFAGGCTLASAEDVAAADLDTLQSLVDKSLLRRTGERFWMLETILEYAREQLQDSGETRELHQRHARHFLALAEEAEPHLRGSPGEWLERLGAEHDNLRAALDVFEASDEGGLRLAGALWRFWYLRGHLTEGRRRLEGALGADGRAAPARAKALIGGAVMAVNSGDVEATRQRAGEALALHRELGDRWGVGYSLFMLGHVAPDPVGKRDLYEQSARLFREIGDEHSALLATRNLAWTYEEVGDVERARELHEQNLRRARETGNGRLQASALGSLAMMALDDGRLEDAASMLRESLQIHRGLGDVLDTVVELSRFTAVLARKGQARTAATLLASFDAAGEDIGGRRSAVADLNEDTLARIQAQLDEAAFAEAWQQGVALTREEAVALALEAPS